MASSEIETAEVNGSLGESEISERLSNNDSQDIEEDKVDVTEKARGKETMNSLDNKGEIRENIDPATVLPRSNEPSSSGKVPIATNHEVPVSDIQNESGENSDLKTSDENLVPKQQKENDLETGPNPERAADVINHDNEAETVERISPVCEEPAQASDLTTGNPSHSSIHHHIGGSHKFSDEESRAEYMKIKSEVTGEAETSESEDEEEIKEHHGSHHSPDSKTRAEYRKIKFEVTGDSQTSDSDDDDDAEMPGLIDDVTLTRNKSSGEDVVAEKGADNSTEGLATGKGEDSQDEWTDILGNGLLMKRVLRAGKGRETRPDRGQIVMLRTAGHLEDGTGADWNQCAQFILGDGEVIHAWDLAVSLMEVEEVCELITDAKYAYGEHGRKECTPPVPPNAKITYELELMAVREGPDIETMSDEDRLKIGDKKRELGNELYGKGDFSAAINSYQRALKYLQPSSSESVQELRLKCWNNMAAAQLKVKAYSAAVTSCNQVLQVDQDNVKAIFRKGKVLAAQGELADALPLIKKANQLDPSNKTIRAELATLRRRKTTQDTQERDMYQRMVGGLGEEDKPKQSSGVFSWSLIIGATVVALGGILAAIYITRH